MKQIVGCLCYKSPIKWWIRGHLASAFVASHLSWREVISGLIRLICFWCHLYPYVLLWAARQACFRGATPYFVNWYEC
jgi:hypothetical protein